MNDLPSQINFNGNLTDPNIPLATAFNRSLRFGDGLFETMYWDGHQIHNRDFHLDRLFQGLQVLRFDLSSGFTREFIAAEILKLCVFNSAANKARVRLTVFREDGARLLPLLNKPVFLIESAVFAEENKTPLRLTIFKGESKSTGVLSVRPVQATCS
jgi:branched-chain amino acid aminotransferase